MFCRRLNHWLAGSLIGWALGFGLGLLVMGVIHPPRARVEVHEFGNMVVRECRDMLTSPSEVVKDRDNDGIVDCVSLLGRKHKACEFHVLLQGQNAMERPDQVAFILFPSVGGGGVNNIACQIFSVALGETGPPSFLLLKGLDTDAHSIWYGDGNGDGFLDTMKDLTDSTAHILLGNEWRQVAHLDWGTEPCEATGTDARQRYVLDSAAGWIKTGLDNP